MTGEEMGHFYTVTITKFNGNHYSVYLGSGYVKGDYLFYNMEVHAKSIFLSSVNVAGQLGLEEIEPGVWMVSDGWVGVSAVYSIDDLKKLIVSSKPGGSPGPTAYGIPATHTTFDVIYVKEGKERILARNVSEYTWTKWSWMPLMAGAGVLALILVGKKIKK